MFYDVFSKLCMENGYSTSGACVAMGIAKAAPGKWRDRNSGPSAGTLYKIANFFNVDLESLKKEEIVYLPGEKKAERKSAATEQPANSGIDEELLNLLMDLTPEEVSILKGFVSGLKAKRK